MDYKNKYLACLLGGAMGDALGYPIEFMSKSEIVSEYGENGIRDLSVDKKTGKALISDDTQMTLFTFTLRAFDSLYDSVLRQAELKI